jgi:anti-sigma factor RsiW
MTMEQMKTNCTGMESKLADVLLDPENVPAKVQAHLDACEDCRAELKELRATMSLMDTWKVPEPSPYFLSKLDARMREERATAPAGWLERLRARLAYGPSMHVRPLAAMALAVVLLVGGGTYLGVTDGQKTASPQPQAYVVHDLQTLDNNAQLLEQLDSISNSDENNGD